MLIFVYVVRSFIFCCHSLVLQNCMTVVNRHRNVEPFEQYISNKHTRMKLTRAMSVYD